MSRKTMVWGGMMVGSSIGGFLPALWSPGSNVFSFSGILLSAVGGVIGVLIGFKFGN